MRPLLVFACVVGCAQPREAPQDAPPPLPDVLGVPEGAWEPDPGAGRHGAHMVADATGIWFVYGRTAASPASEVWLTKTTSTGDVVVAPTRVDGAERAAWPMAIARSGDNVAVVFEHGGAAAGPQLRLYDRDGQPLRDAGHVVPLAPVSRTDMTNLALAARADGSMQLFAVHRDAALATEVAVVELDAAGDPLAAATLFGTDDEGSPLGLAAAVYADGATFVAWDRRYDVCAGHTHADATLLTRVAADGAIAPIVDVGPLDAPTHEPALAAHGETAYLARTTATAAGWVIRLARAGDPGLALADVGDPQHYNETPMLALAAPGRGALAWRTSGPALRVASLRDDGATVAIGPVHVVPLPATEGFAGLRGIVHVGDERYLVSWTTDTGSQHARLYAMVVDLATMPKPAPAEWVPVAQTPPSATRRCSH